VWEKADALEQAEGSKPECVRASVEVATGVLGSGRQGLDLAGESPVILIARFEYVAIPQFVKGNLTSIAWCKRPGRSGDVDLQRWVQPGGLASMGA